jgi:hypothetical protein
MTEKFITNHWGICESDGALRYDDDGRAHVYDTRKNAREVLKEIQPDDSAPLHVEKVHIR